MVTAVLVPFAPLPIDVRVDVEVERAGPVLRLRYEVGGPGLGAVSFAARAERPERRDRLWERTCFELFAARPGEEGYVELNFAPSGDCAAYRFARYREGMGVLPLDGCRVVELPGASDGGGARAWLGEVALPASLAAAGALELGLSAVIEEVRGARHFLALAHPGDRPDFHDRRGWLVRG